MAFVSPTGLLCVIPVVTTAPESGKRAGFRVCEYGRAIDNARVGGVVDGDFDHINAEQCRTVIPGGLVKTSRQFLRVTNARNARVVNDQSAILAGAGNDRMRVRAATRLHGADLSGLRQI